MISQYIISTSPPSARQTMWALGALVVVTPTSKAQLGTHQAHLLLRGLDLFPCSPASCSPPHGQTLALLVPLRRPLCCACSWYRLGLDQATSPSSTATNTVGGSTMRRVDCASAREKEVRMMKFQCASRRMSAGVGPSEESEDKGNGDDKVMFLIFCSKKKLDACISEGPR
jgi:hypothetical protein